MVQTATAPAVVQTAAVARRKRRLDREALAGYLFVAPSLVELLDLVAGAADV